MEKSVLFFELKNTKKASFREFEFDGYTYHHVISKFSDGVECSQFAGGVAVTNMERTIIDSIKDMDKVAGIEEILQNVESVLS